VPANGAEASAAPAREDLTGVRRVAKNTLFFAAMRIAQYLLLFGFTVFAARRLGVRDFGTLTLGLSLTALIGVTADFGLGRLANREIARDREHIAAIVNNSLSAKLVLSAISLGLVILAVNLLGYPVTTRQVVYLLGISMVFFSFEVFFEGVFKGVEKMEYQAYSATTDKLLTFAIGLTLLLAGQGVLAVAGAFVAARFFSLVVALTIYRRRLARPRLALDRAQIAKLLRDAWPFAVFGLLGTSYLQIDTIVLSQLKGTDSVGVYQAALRLVLVLMVIPEAVSEAVFPGMARLFHSSRARLNAVYATCLRAMWMSGLPVSVGLCLLADKIIVPIYGRPFAGAVVLLQITGLMIVPRFLAYVPGTLLTAIDQQRLRTAVAGICVVVSVAANLMLIPRAGAAGAATAAVFTNVTLFGAYALLARREGVPGISAGDALKPLGAALIMAAFLHLLRGLSIALLVPGGVLVYLGVLCALGGISADDRAIVRECLARPAAGDSGRCA
jgi:O-antigen/teichoic acid export membrane protein